MQRLGGPTGESVGRHLQWQNLSGILPRIRPIPLSTLRRLSLSKAKGNSEAFLKKRSDSFKKDANGRVVKISIRQ